MRGEDTREIGDIACIREELASATAVVAEEEPEEDDAQAGQRNLQRVDGQVPPHADNEGPAAPGPLSDAFALCPTTAVLPHAEGALVRCDRCLGGRHQRREVGC